MTAPAPQHIDRAGRIMAEASRGVGLVGMAIDYAAGRAASTTQVKVIACLLAQMDAAGLEPDLSGLLP